MKRPNTDGSLRPWPLALLSIVAITSGTGLLSGGDSRNAAGEALIVMGGLVVGAWVAMTAAQLGGKVVSGFSEKDREGRHAAKEDDDDEEHDGV